MSAALKTVHTESGLMVQDLVIGDGKVATGRGKTVTVYYTGWLEDGTEFDSSVSPQCTVQISVAGWLRDFGMGRRAHGHASGGKRKLTTAEHMAQGEVAAGKMIPKNAILIFEIELLHIRK